MHNYINKHKYEIRCKYEYKCEYIYVGTRKDEKMEISRHACAQFLLGASHCAKGAAGRDSGFHWRRWELWGVGSLAHGGVLSHGGTPSCHPFIDRFSMIFPKTNHLGVPPWPWKPPKWCTDWAVDWGWKDQLQCPAVIKLGLTDSQEANMNIPW